MKKLLLFLFIIPLSFVACNMNTSKESKAKKLIKEYLKTNMNDWDSYEPLEFSKLDSTFATVYDDDEYDKLYRLKSEYEDKAHDYCFKSNYRNYRKFNRLEEECRLKAKEIEAQMDSMENNYIKPFNGWAMSHKFRALNGFGGKIIEVRIFKFNKNITKIEKVYDIEDLNGLWDLEEKKPLIKLVQELFLIQ